MLFRQRIMMRFQREVMGIKEDPLEAAAGEKRQRDEEPNQPQYKIQVSNIQNKNFINFVIQPIREGEGEILVSHTTVHGFKTKFQDVLEVGDTLILKNPEAKEGEDEEEQRKINMVLSHKSLGVEEPFSFVPSSKTPFKYQKKPVLNEEDKTFEEFLNEKMKERKREKKEEKKKKYTIVEVREKKGMWGYKTKKIKVKGQLSRGEILDIRAQAAGDKTGLQNFMLSIKD